MSRYSKEVNRYLVGIKKGHTAQFKELFDLTYNHLCVVAKTYLLDKSHCDDVVMDTYDRALRYINSFKEGQDGYNWLCRIAQRSAYSFNKSEKNYFGSLPIDDLSLTYDERALTDDKVELSCALDKLDEQSKKIVLRYYYLGETFEEIGREMGMTKSGVNKRLKKILKELKKFLNDGNF